MTQTPSTDTGLAIDEMPWPDRVPRPPTDLPYDDGDKMESPWHFKMCVLLPEEAERQRADDLVARVAALEAELRGLRGEEPSS